MYKDFIVKAKEGDYLYAVKFNRSPDEIVLIRYDGVQMFVPDDPEKSVKTYQAEPGREHIVFEYHKRMVPGIAEVVKPENLNAFHRAIYQTEVEEAYKLYEAHVRKLWKRVSIADVLDYIDRIHQWADMYDGISERGYEDKPMICADWNPPKMKRLGDWIEKFYHGNIEVDWSDEWMRCECGKAVRSQADSYGWEPSYVWLSDYDIACIECANDSLEEIIEHYQNKTTHALPSWMAESAEKAGFHCLETDEAYCTRFETGWRRGQDDTPEKALKLAKGILPYKFDYLFTISDRGQFDIKWNMLVRKQGVEEEVES